MVLDGAGGRFSTSRMICGAEGVRWALDGFTDACAEVDFMLSEAIWLTGAN